MSRIVWLASYPKSGNTWVRVFLANFLKDTGASVDINTLNTGPVASNRSLFDGLSGVESSDLTDAEIECHRPDVYRYLAARSAETLYLKIHDAYTFTPTGEPLIPSDATSSVIYLVRNPLDVAVSFAHHFSCTIEETIERMGGKTAPGSEVRRSLKTQLKQRWLSWREHVSSWLDQRSIPVHVIRYEDMCCEPVEVFTSFLRFLGFADDPCRVRRAVEFSSFENLRQQEQARGFKERLPAAASFFRRGRPGGWREELNAEQAARIIADHGVVMKRIGYSTDNVIPDHNHEHDHLGLEGRPAPKP